MSTSGTLVNWKSYYKTALFHCFREGAESCIVLLVLAPGKREIALVVSLLFHWTRYLPECAFSWQHWP